VGVSACLMAPLTAYRRWLEPTTLMRANSWMLMTGSLGMVASTLPVQWLVPLVGWRLLFVGLGLMVVAAVVLIAWQVPRWGVVSSAEPQALASGGSYAEVWRHPYFRKMAPIGFFVYGGLVAIQTLWAAPWMMKVAGYSSSQAASGLFWINVAMLMAFWAWGLVSPWLARRGMGADRLIALGLPVSFALLAIIIICAKSMNDSATGLLALYCVSCTFVALAQPAVGMAFSSALAGRALSAYNLVIFSGVFVIQWGMGLAIDGLKTLGLEEVAAFQWSMGLFLMCCLASYVYFLVAKSHNPNL
jgi:predicted MFS family arabinose efflux permease